MEMSIADGETTTRKWLDRFSRLVSKNPRYVRTLEKLSKNLNDSLDTEKEIMTMLEHWFDLVVSQRKDASSFRRDQISKKFLMSTTSFELLVDKRMNFMQRRQELVGKFLQSTGN
jgi:hypothetical protein